jgi:hypothetical protein
VIFDLISVPLHPHELDPIAGHRRSSQLIEHGEIDGLVPSNEGQPFGLEPIDKVRNRSGIQKTNAGKLVVKAERRVGPEQSSAMLLLAGLVGLVALDQRPRAAGR